MVGSVAHDEDGVVDEDEREDTEEHEDGDEHGVNEDTEIHDVGNNMGGLIKTTCNLPSLIPESDLARSQSMHSAIPGNAMVQSAISDFSGSESAQWMRDASKCP